MRHATILVAILAFVPLASATVQVRIFRPSGRVRVTGHFCQPFYSNCIARRVGTFVAWKSDTLVVQSNGDTLSVPVDLVTRFDMSRGPKTNTGRGAGIGFLLGGLAGAVVVGKSCTDEWVVTPGQCALLGGFVFGAVGALFGALVGSTTKTERWREVSLDRLRVSLGPQRDGRFGLGLSGSF